jgi:isoprenylcysteine carboxyl methyltransferase (ICMT) family protein YpbQ
LVIDPGVVTLTTFFAGAVSFRLLSVAVSIRHEKELKLEGAIEIGVVNSRILAVLHALFYVSCFVEGLYRGAILDTQTVTGLVLFVFSAAMLAVVMRILGRLWTVKLLIAPDHELVTHPLFRIVRHPNYFLNLVPELVGFALVTHAVVAPLMLFPLYAISLVRRIQQEDQAMQTLRR